MLSILAEELIPETVEKILESKPVKEKKLELEKKLEGLRKKHEKVVLIYLCQAPSLHTHLFLLYPHNAKSYVISISVQGCPSLSTSMVQAPLLFPILKKSRIF